MNMLALTINKAGYQVSTLPVASKFQCFLTGDY